jgi:hypothetical protein
MAAGCNSCRNYINYIAHVRFQRSGFLLHVGSALGGTKVLTAQPSFGLTFLLAVSQRAAFKHSNVFHYLGLLDCSSTFLSLCLVNTQLLGIGSSAQVRGMHHL